jgi:hypothetical protein
MLTYACLICGHRRPWPLHLPEPPTCALCDGLMQPVPAPPAPPAAEPLEVLADDDDFGRCADCGEPLCCYDGERYCPDCVSYTLPDEALAC